jgi:hypothetical protein
VTVKVAQARARDARGAEERIRITEIRAPFSEAAPQEHDIVRRNRRRGRRARAFVVEPVDGDTARLRREGDVLDEGAGYEIDPAGPQPGDERLDERFVSD